MERTINIETQAIDLEKALAPSLAKGLYENNMG